MNEKVDPVCTVLLTPADSFTVCVDITNGSNRLLPSNRRQLPMVFVVVVFLLPNFEIYGL